MSDFPPLPQPYSRQWINCPFTERLLYTADQMRAYAEAHAAAMVARERERCALICESQPERLRGDGVWACDQQACADAIRATPTEPKP